MLSGQLRALPLGCKPTTYSGMFVKKQTVKMLQCHNTFEVGNARACLSFLPEFSVRFREDPRSGLGLLRFLASFHVSRLPSPHKLVLRSSGASWEGSVPQISEACSSSGSVFAFQWIPMFFFIRRQKILFGRVRGRVPRWNQGVGVSSRDTLVEGL